jgi:hypothetical protein
MIRCLYFIISILIIASTSPADEFRGIKRLDADMSEGSQLGSYYAYIIGINAYADGWTNLKTAVKDAQELKDTLISKYDFEDNRVILRVDDQATQNNIINDLKYFVSILKERDNFLIYFAGHGQVDEFLGDGYWIPVDGIAKNPGTWISHSSIRNILSSEKLKAKNIALISDSCYSGALLRSTPSSLSITEHDYANKILALSSLRSRQVFTSGGVEPVADGGRDGHSLFAYYFLKALKDNNLDYIDLENLFHAYVWRPVAEIGDQRPYIGRLKTIMDENGQFVLLQRSAKNKLPINMQALEKTAAMQPMILQPTSKKNRKIAILPFHLSVSPQYQYATPEALKDDIISVIVKYFKEAKNHNITHSYYDLKIEFAPKKIGEEIIDDLWISNWYSIDAIPNLEKFCDLGKKLNVDEILTYYCYVGQNKSIIKAFLIDVANKNLKQAEDDSSSSMFRSDIRMLYFGSITKQLFK